MGPTNTLSLHLATQPQQVRFNEQAIPFTYVDGRVTVNNLIGRGTLVVEGKGIPGDLDANGTVDILDLQRMVNVLLGLETNPKADLNQDGSATVQDLQLLVNLLLGG